MLYRNIWCDMEGGTSMAEFIIAHRILEAMPPNRLDHRRLRYVAVQVGITRQSADVHNQSTRST